MKALALRRTYRLPSRTSRWSFTLAVCLLAAWLTLVLGQLIAPMQFMFLWVAVILSALYGGIASGVIASLITTVCGALLLFESHGPASLEDPVNLLRLSLYLALGGLLAWAVGWRREAQIEAERLRHWLETSVSSLGEALIATDNRGRILLVNPPAERITGVSREEAFGRTSSEVFHAIDSLSGERIPDPLMAALGDEVPIELSGRVEILTEEDRLPIEGTAAPIRDMDGAILGGVLVFRDVSATRRAEADLRASESRFRLMADSAPVFIWTSGSDSLYDFVNQTWLRFTGRTLEQETGNGWAAGIHPEDFDRAMTTYLEAFERRVPFEMEYRLKRYDGAFRWIVARGTPRFGGERQFDGYIGSCIDITERKEAENARERITDHLAAAAEALASSNRAKDEFLATLSHELRTPLTAVLGWTHLLREGNLDDHARESALDTIERGARSQVRLVDDILDVSRIITGKLSVAHDPVDLASSVEEAIDALRPWASEHHVGLDLRVPSNAVVVEGDAERLRQVVSNLVTNAIKFSPAGESVQIQLETDGAETVLSVTDHGVGIPSEFLPYVFDRFSQAEVGFTRSHGGLGLGLAIVRHLVELHGGRVSVHSDGAGKGARFEIRCPIADSARRLAPVKPSTARQLASAAILVVDNDPHTLGVIVAVLRQAGAKPIGASSADEALSIAKKSPPDLVLTDIAMPGSTGFHLLRALREEARVTAPVVALTAHGSPEDEARALGTGFALYLRKPVVPGELAAMLAGVLSGNPPSPSGP